MEAGTVLAGKYRIGAVLGRGGMGVVTAAQHLQLRQPVAIKFLHPVVGHDGDAVQRLLREAQAAARLRSEHVARVLDVGALDNGAPFIVMEHLDGQDLASVVRAGPLAPSAAVDVIVQACDALAEAHALGIIHRDLKPSNLFVTRRPDGTSLVKVLDFGISKNPIEIEPAPTIPSARLAGDIVDTARSTEADTVLPAPVPLPPPVSAFADPASTRTEAIMGTPEYMSPEHMLSSKHVDARTDVWSLGVVLYELLTGQRPFRGDGRVALRVAVETAVLPPLGGKVPAGLVRAVARCLEKAPGDRFQDVAALAAALAPFATAPDLAHAAAARMSRVLHGRAATADGDTYRETSRARRSRLRATAAAGVVAAAAGLFFALGPDAPAADAREPDVIAPAAAATPPAAASPAPVLVPSVVVTPPPTTTERRAPAKAKRRTRRTTPPATPMVPTTPSPTAPAAAVTPETLVEILEKRN